MCESTAQLGCTTTLEQIWAGISHRRYNTKRFVVIRNDRIIYDRGGTEPYFSYSASKGLLGAPTLVHAMSSCGLGLKDPAGRWLSHGEGSRWSTEYPWTDITLEHLATHTSGICDYENPDAVCGDQNPDWQRDFDITNGGGPDHPYPNDAFTIARTQSEQNGEPPLPPCDRVLVVGPVSVAEVPRVLRHQRLGPGRSELSQRRLPESVQCRGIAECPCGVRGDGYRQRSARRCEDVCEPSWGRGPCPCCGERATRFLHSSLRAPIETNRNEHFRS
jgi:hypothetical protein